MSEKSPFHPRISVSILLKFYFVYIFLLERSFNNILPRPLARSHTVAVDEMETTNGHFHNKKTHQPPLTNVAYKRAPGSYNVHYMKHNLEVRCLPFVNFLDAKLILIYVF